MQWPCRHIGVFPLSDLAVSRATVPSRVCPPVRGRARKERPGSTLLGVSRSQPLGDPDHSARVQPSCCVRALAMPLCCGDGERYFIFRPSCQSRPFPNHLLPSFRQSGRCPRGGGHWDPLSARCWRRLAPPLLVCCTVVPGLRHPKGSVTPWIWGEDSAAGGTGLAQSAEQRSRGSGPGCEEPTRRWRGSGNPLSVLRSSARTECVALERSLSPAEGTAPP